MAKKIIYTLLALAISTQWAAALTLKNGLKITPLFETAGIIIQTTDANIPITYKNIKTGKSYSAYPLTQYDKNHAATSLFNLSPGTDYEVTIKNRKIKFSTLSANKTPLTQNTVTVEPGQSIVNAVKKASPGTTIKIKPGNYAEFVSLNNIHGKPDKPIIISGLITNEELNKPINERTLPTISSPGLEFGIKVDNCSHLIIENLCVKNTKSTGVDIRNSSWITFQHNQAYDNSKWFNVYIGKGGDASHHIFIQYNHIADLTDRKFSYTHKGVENVTYYGITREHNAGWAHVIRGNLVEGHSDGIHSSSLEKDCQKANENQENILAKWQDYEVDIYDNIFNDHHDDGIETDGICVNQRVFRNKIKNCTNAISISPSLPGPFFIYRNQSRYYKEGGIKINTAEGRGVIRNIYFFHNTFSREHKKEDGKGAIINIWDGTPSKNLVMKNNLFYGPQRAMTIQEKRTHKPDFDYNLWFADGKIPTDQISWWGHWRKTFKEGWQGELKMDRNGLWANPKLNEDLSLKASSPARDRALKIPGINDNYEGKAPDIGAIEYKK